MDKFLKPASSCVNDSSSFISRKRKADCEGTGTHRAAKRKYDSSYIAFGFAEVFEKGEPRPKCVICGIVLSNESLRPSKLKIHLSRAHPKLVDKSKDFFQMKLKDSSSQSDMMRNTFRNTPEASSHASFVLSANIAAAKKPYTIGEELLKPCLIDAARIVLGDSAAKKLETIPLSADTVKRRVDRIAEDIEGQLAQRINNSYRFAIQLDESTDVAGDAQFLCFVRFIFGAKCYEELMFCKSVEGRCTAAELFRILNTWLIQHDIKWEKCVGICTDGARVMTGKHKGLVQLVKEAAPEATATHCFIHREALVAKRIPQDLRSVLSSCVKIINYIKSRPLNARLFQQLCVDMDATHQTLLLHTEVRWLSRGKVLVRLHELREEVGQFLTQHGHDLAANMSDVRFLCRVAYLADITEKLNSLNRILQGPNSTIFDTTDAVRGFQKKIEIWKNNVLALNFEMFPTLADHVRDTCSEQLEMKTCVLEHLSLLSKLFSDYFTNETSDKSKWIRNPFASDMDFSRSILSCEEQEQLADISCSSALRDTFGTVPITDFWAETFHAFPDIARKALSYLLPFPTTYLCEQTFSALASIKTKSRNCLEVENCLRVAVSKITPSFDTIALGQAHQSH